MNAYEFLFFSDNLVPKPDKLTALDVFRKSLALGTSNSSVHLFTFELIEVGSSVEFSIGPVQQKNLGLKKPITQLEICDNKKLVVLCDNLLQVLSVPSLDPSYNATKLKNVTSFQVNSAIYEKSMEIYIGTKKKSILLVLLGDSKPHIVRDIHLPEVPLCFRVDGDQICVSLWSRYLLVNCGSSPVATQQQHQQQQQQQQQLQQQQHQFQELFSIEDGQRLNPIVELVDRGEFLVTGMNNLGIFVSAQDGSSRRPPLQLDSNTLAVASAPPYVLSLSDEFLTVHSGLHYERQQVQTHSVNGGLALAVARDFARCGALSHLIIIACQSGDLQAALPLPWYSQVEQMLREGQVDEAMRVAAHARQAATDAGQSSEELLARFRRLQQTAGVACLRRATDPRVGVGGGGGGGSAEDAQKATQYLVEGRTDPRHLLGHLCRGVLGGDLAAQQQQQPPPQQPPPPEGLAELGDMCAADPARQRAVKAFLLDLLLKYRVSRFTRDCRKEADTALLKLCAELRPDQCETLIYSDLQCDAADCLASLAATGRHHLRALLLRWLGRVPEACQVWRDLADGRLPADPQFLGVGYFTDYLATLDDPDAFWPHAERLLADDPVRHLGVLTARRRAGVSAIEPGDIVARLESAAGSSMALMLYLEFLLQATGDYVKDEKLHTRLCTLYLEAIEDAAQTATTPDSDAAASLRSRLLAFLRSSTAYRAQFVLGRLQQLQSRIGDSGDTGLQPHRAELLARCGDVDAALRVLILELGDCDAAAELCAAQASPEPFWSALLAICLSAEHRERLLGPAVRLLNRPDVPADGARVLPLLPANYPVGSLRPFLCSALRRALQRRRSARLAKGLAVAAQLSMSAQLARMPHSRVSVRLADATRCAVCGGRFDSDDDGADVGGGVGGGIGRHQRMSAFVLISSGQPAHLRCCQGARLSSAASPVSS